MLVNVVILVSLLLQLLAAALAFRLNWKYGRRPAWTLISSGIFLMALYRGVSLYLWNEPILVPPNEPAPELPSVAITPDATDTMRRVVIEYPFPVNIEEMSAFIALIISVMILAGVAFIEPVFRAFNHVQKVLRREKATLEETVRAFDKEFAIARAVQEELFPLEPPTEPGFDLFGASRSANLVGGDYFDYLRLCGQRLGIVVADASGHGLGAALVATDLRAYLRALTLAQNGDDIERILTSTNQLLVRDTRHDHFATAFVVLLDPAASTISYIGAGQQGYLVRSSGKSEVLESTCVPLGLVEEFDATPSPTIMLDDGDIVVLASDGLHEAHAPDESIFGSERPLELIREAKDESAEAIGSRLIAAIEEFSHGKLSDDATIVILEKTGAERTDRGA